MDEAYIFRLEKGEKRGPTRDLVIKLGLRLMQGSSVTIDDVNELLTLQIRIFNIRLQLIPLLSAFETRVENLSMPRATIFQLRIERMSSD